MNNIEVAINLGYHIDYDGVVIDKDNKIIKTYLKNNTYIIFYFTYMKKKYRIYASRLQSYKKFGKKSFEENVSYINGNTLDCSYDNIILRSMAIEIKNNQEKKNMYNM